MCQIFSALFIILVGLDVTLFSEQMLNSTRCIQSFMSNLIKKSWTVSTSNRSFVALNPGQKWVFLNHLPTHLILST